MATDPKVLDPPASITDDLAQVRKVEARVLAGAYERIHADMERARRLGLIDEHGNRISKEWPADMQPGAKRDFGG